jgi:hypothetical protein
VRRKQEGETGGREAFARTLFIERLGQPQGLEQVGAAGAAGSRATGGLRADRHGDRYNVTPAISELRNDPEFLNAVLENAQLFAFGLGYDLVTGQVIDPTRADHYAVRLYKCGRALHLWGMPEAHRAFVGCVEYLLEGHRELAKTLNGIRADETPELNPLGIDLVIPSVQHPHESI